MEDDGLEIGKSGNFSRMFCAIAIAVISGAIIHNALFNQNSRVFSATGVSISADSTKLDKLFSVLNIGPDSVFTGRTRMTVEPRDQQIPLQAPPVSDRQTLKAQQELKRIGLYTGPADGVLGDRTRLAIRLYQRKNGLRETGEPDQDLIDHMNYVRHIEQAATITGSVSPLTDPESVRTVQRGLVRLGYDAGPPDGKFGDRTRDALKAFQTDLRLTANGRITPEVLERLER